MWLTAPFLAEIEISLSRKELFKQGGVLKMVKIYSLLAPETLGSVSNW